MSRPELRSRDWQVRLERLSKLLSGAGVLWNPWGWNAVIRVRRGTRLPPEIVEETRSCLDMLRAIVAGTTTAVELREFLLRCSQSERNAKLVHGSDPALAARWRELAERTSRTGAVYLEEADELVREVLGDRVLRIEVVEPGEAWRPDGPALPGKCLMEADRDYPVEKNEPERRPAASLRSLGALVRAWERGDFAAEERRNDG